MVVCALLAAITCAGPALGARGRAHPKASILRNASVTMTSEDAAPVPAAPTLRWAAPHLPAGGALSDGATTVVHTVRTGETWASIADAYVDLTSIYDAAELAKAIANENTSSAAQAKREPTPGLHVRIPHILASAPKTGAAERIGLPKDGVMRGLYVRGTTAGAKGYPALLDKIVAHGMNAIVLDVKDYDGPLTYPSKVPLAVESGAVHKPPMRSYARAVRFAHQRGVRVIARVSCFNDQLMAKAHPGMAIRGVSGHVYRNGWLDPQNDRAQAYVADLVKEALDAGVDEIQLDYVRFPVVGMKNIDFGLDTKANPNAKVEVITRFVEHIHSITHAHGVPLSLDVFGVIAFGKKTDIQNLGQDPVALAKHSEFLSAMVYPSHFDEGFMGLDQPADHPELVGLGVKHMRAEMEERGLDLDRSAKIRPWLQAMRHKSSNYGAGYIQDEIRTGDKAGASGWLLWNPGQVYDVAWSAVPKVQPHSARPTKKLTEVSLKHYR
ncbi:MAG: putative glycoside hydrolase [Labilithrix sp.]|nr:putative glycoside hydrolase [Labilithrix sp.]